MWAVIMITAKPSSHDGCPFFLGLCCNLRRCNLGLWSVLVNYKPREIQRYNIEVSFSPAKRFVFEGADRAPMCTKHRSPLETAAIGGFSLIFIPRNLWLPVSLDDTITGVSQFWPYLSESIKSIHLVNEQGLYY